MIHTNFSSYMYLYILKHERRRSTTRHARHDDPRVCSARAHDISRDGLCAREIHERDHNTGGPRRTSARHAMPPSHALGTATSSAIASVSAGRTHPGANEGRSDSRARAARQLGSAARYLGSSIPRQLGSAARLGTSEARLGTSAAQLGSSARQLRSAARQLGSSAAQLGSSALRGVLSTQTHTGRCRLP